MLLLVGATADSCVLCVLCRVFMIRTAALAKICWEVLPAERYSLQEKKLQRGTPCRRYGSLDCAKFSL
jgi:hypothetical protein